MKKKVCPNCNKRELIYNDEKGYVCLYCEKKRNEMEGLREEREIDTSIIYDPLIEDFTIRRIRTSNHEEI